jgi:O-antigen ligase
LVDPAFRDAVFDFTHLHNEYITNIVSAGILGLVSVLALLFVPFIIFLKSINHSDARIYSSMGILLCVSYAGIGMTHIAFGEENVNALFIFFLSFILPKVQCMTRA